jgi:hypothetical protein
MLRHSQAQSGLRAGDIMSKSTAAPPDPASLEHRDEVIEATKAALRHRISSGGPLTATNPARINR